ncbi:MAG: TetR/AcrR family transcriptional regulator [Pseudomonadota bacterium]
MSRTLRRDARARIANLLRAACNVFAEEGIEAPLDRFAVRENAGRATPYRNFPGRTEIELAVPIDEVTALAERVRRPESPDAFLDFLAHLSERLERNAAFGRVLAVTPVRELLPSLRETIVYAGAAALAVSQTGGRVRADLGPADIRMVAAMRTAGLHNARPKERRALAARALELVLAASRAPR